ncbi:TolC family protein, partial [Streptococcus pyogenes]
SGQSDLGGFFGFEQQDVTPSSVAVELSQTLFASGAVRAGVSGGEADRRRSGQILRAAEAGLTVAVVAAYAEVQVAEQA